MQKDIAIVRVTQSTRILPAQKKAANLNIVPVVTLKQAQPRFQLPDTATAHGEQLKRRLVKVQEQRKEPAVIVVMKSQTPFLN